MRERVVAATERFASPPAGRFGATTRALVALALLAAVLLVIARSAGAQDEAVSEAVRAEATPAEAGDPAPIAPPKPPSDPFASEPRFVLRGGDFTFGSEYPVTRNLGLGIAYDRFNVSMEDEGGQGYRIDNSWNTAYLDGVARF